MTDSTVATALFVRLPTRCNHLDTDSRPNSLRNRASFNLNHKRPALKSGKSKSVSRETQRFFARTGISHFGLDLRQPPICIDTRTCFGYESRGSKTSHGCGSNQ